MSELRQRQAPQRIPEEQRTLLHKSKGGTGGGYQRAPPPPRRSDRSLHIAFSLMILVFFVIYANNKNSAPIKYTVDGTKLPQWYALCGTWGRPIYTLPVEGGEGKVECVVVNGKYIADTGSLARIRGVYGDRKTNGAMAGSPAEVQKQGGLRIIYLPRGYTITPGLIDAHGHPLQYGHSLQLPLANTTTKEDVISRVEAYVLAEKSKPDFGQRWIEGMGWNQNRWTVQEFPSASDLDASPILKGLPIVLSRIDVHALWVSQAVLDAMGDLPKEVDGGHIVRDLDGNPTGIFIDNAMDLVIAVQPPWTDIQRESFLEKMMDDALAVGMTGVHDAMVAKGDYEFYRKKAEKGGLRMRFYPMVYCEDRDRYCGDDFPRINGAQDGRLEVRSVKLFADGALGSRGAALLEDYSDQPGWNGLLLKPESAWKPLIQEWYDNGWQVNVHTIGDRANKVALDAIEAVLGGRPSDRRFRLEHAQILTVSDLERAARLGVIASYQPTHATSDMWYAEERLGAERIKGAYAWRTYLNLGGRIALGSDFPVESIDPLKGFYAAVTRLDESGKSPHGKNGWYPSEKLTRLEALRGMTVDAAYASYSNDTGSLEIGKRFDAVIWNDDLFKASVDEILQAQVKATIVDGQVAYGVIKL